ncbi:hypothetical protein I5M32_00920 [Pedobacter sp. SD-b]|uniref:HD domain-containing protein n=1 Tax=Pedobacter segetis TaxID=2793069 RepID=A0ABS1BF74_9SPHI|nr:hypothetical protein [Pedobacter segetis]
MLNKVEEFVSQHLRNNLSPKLYFHNYSHTKEVVFAVKEIKSHCFLNTQETEILTIAAWFHDCGYSVSYKGHENESCRIAVEFLKNNNFPNNLTFRVTDCILATKYPQQPKNILEDILCDADLFHFTRTDYERHHLSLRKEWEIYLNKKYTDQEWKQLNCDLLKNHHYFTKYGKNILEKFKAVNLKLMEC